MTDDVIAAGELTTEHYGRLVSWQPSARPDGTLPTRRNAVCDELRRWAYQGRRRVEITDLTPDGAFAGRSFHLDADTPVVVHQRVRKPRRRPWGVGALRPGETWADIETEGAGV